MTDTKVKKTWIDVKRKSSRTKFSPVMSEDNEKLYSISENGTDLCLDVKMAFRKVRRGFVRKYTGKDIMLSREEKIYLYLENNRPDFYDKISCLILKVGSGFDDKRYTLDADKLLDVFPNLKTVLHSDAFAIDNAENKLCLLVPFELGEMCFLLAQDGDNEAAETHHRDLWELAPSWAKFFLKVIKDYYRKPEDHPKDDPYGPVICDGMDELFRIYLLGWSAAIPFFDEEEAKTVATNHKNLDKAINLLRIRFQNCGDYEIGEKLYWDFQHLTTEASPDYEEFKKILFATEKLIPGSVMCFLKTLCCFGFVKDKSVIDMVLEVLTVAPSIDMTIDNSIVAEFQNYIN